MTLRFLSLLRSAYFLQIFSFFGGRLMKKLRWTPACSGMAAGLLNGLLGAGGGVVLVPLLLRVHRLP